jgi:hypothetical protein
LGKPLVNRAIQPKMEHENSRARSALLAGLVWIMRLRRVRPGIWGQSFLSTLIWGDDAGPRRPPLAGFLEMLRTRQKGILASEYRTSPRSPERAPRISLSSGQK